MRIAFIFFCAFSLLLACSGPRNAAQIKQAENFIKLVSKGKYEDAYRKMSDSYKLSYTFDEFTEDMKKMKVAGNKKGAEMVLANSLKTRDDKREKELIQYTYQLEDDSKKRLVLYFVQGKANEIYSVKWIQSAK